MWTSTRDDMTDTNWTQRYFVSVVDLEPNQPSTNCIYLPDILVNSNRQHIPGVDTAENLSPTVIIRWALSRNVMLIRVGDNVRPS